MDVEHSLLGEDNAVVVGDCDVTGFKLKFESNYSSVQIYLDDDHIQQMVKILTEWGYVGDRIAALKEVCETQKTISTNKIMKIINAKEQ